MTMINLMIFQFIVLDLFFMQTQRTGDRFNVLSVDVNPITGILLYQIRITNNKSNLCNKLCLQVFYIYII